jgi:hypothetical protein
MHNVAAHANKVSRKEFGRLVPDTLAKTLSKQHSHQPQGAQFETTTFTPDQFTR